MSFTFRSNSGSTITVDAANEQSARTMAMQERYGDIPIAWGLRWVGKGLSLIKAETL